MDFRRKKENTYAPLNISGVPMERVSTFKYLGVHITNDLSWSTHTGALVKRKFSVSSLSLHNFYTCTIESILTSNITTWYGNSTIQDRSALQRVVRTAERITSSTLAQLQDIHRKRCRSKTTRILKDTSHPHRGVFTLMRSGRRYHLPRTNTERYRSSFYPQAIRFLNEDTK